MSGVFTMSRQIYNQLADEEADSDTRSDRDHAKGEGEAGRVLDL